MRASIKNASSLFLEAHATRSAEGSQDGMMASVVTILLQCNNYICTEDQKPCIADRAEQEHPL